MDLVSAICEQLLKLSKLRSMKGGDTASTADTAINGLCAAQAIAAVTGSGSYTVSYGGSFTAVPSVVSLPISGVTVTVASHTSSGGLYTGCVLTVTSGGAVSLPILAVGPGVL
jgi:hypothetical protein